MNLSDDIDAALRPIRDAMSKNTDPRSDARWGATVGEHFARASSKNDKLAILEFLVRQAKAKSILEIGTAYGISGIALAMSQNAPKLVSIEGFEPMMHMGPANIKSAISGDLVFLSGDKVPHLKDLARGERKFDLVFHDGGHNGDSYVEDFDTLHPVLEPGCFYVIDDIAWDTDNAQNRAATTSHGSRRTCLEGWTELVADPRVEGAVSFDRRLGILLVS